MIEERQIIKNIIIRQDNSHPEWNGLSAGPHRGTTSKKRLGVVIITYLLSGAAPFLAVLAPVAIIAFFIFFAEKKIVYPITIGQIGIAVFVLIIIAILTYLIGFLVKFARWAEILTRIAIGITMCSAGWLIALIHLWFSTSYFFPKENLKIFQSDF